MTYGCSLCVRGASAQDSVFQGLELAPAWFMGGAAAAGEQQASEKLIAAELKKQRAAFGGGKKKGAMKYKA